jgi:hypothetical protein
MKMEMKMKMKMEMEMGMKMGMKMRMKMTIKKQMSGIRKKKLRIQRCVEFSSRERFSHPNTQNMNQHRWHTHAPGTFGRTPARCGRKVPGPGISLRAATTADCGAETVGEQHTFD